MPMPPLPADLAATRVLVQRLAVHLLARRRAAATGRFGLRASPGGLATPAFGAGPEVLRLAGDRLIREEAGRASVHPVNGATLAELAAVVEVDLSAPFSVGRDTPPLGDPDERLTVDPAAVVALGDWYLFGWRALDILIAELPSGADPSVIQLWPEHFDAGVDVGVGGTRRTNLGASPGDAVVPEPYLYVGPWEPDRPGPAGYWNAPFGAVLPFGQLAREADPLGAASAFLREGVRRLSSST